MSYYVVIVKCCVCVSCECVMNLCARIWFLLVHRTTLQSSHNIGKLFPRHLMHHQISIIYYIQSVYYILANWLLYLFYILQSNESVTQFWQENKQTTRRAIEYKYIFGSKHKCTRAWSTKRFRRWKKCNFFSVLPLFWHYRTIVTISIPEIWFRKMSVIPQLRPKRQPKIVHKIVGNNSIRNEVHRWVMAVRNWLVPCRLRFDRLPISRKRVFVERKLSHRIRHPFKLATINRRQCSRNNIDNDCLARNEMNGHQHVDQRSKFRKFHHNPPDYGHQLMVAILWHSFHCWVPEVVIQRKRNIRSRAMWQAQNEVVDHRCVN